MDTYEAFSNDGADPRPTRKPVLVVGIVLIVLAAALGCTGAALALRPAARPVNTALPVISGPATEGATLKATTGAWTGTVHTYIYRWQTCRKLTCRAISGAAGPGQASYSPQAADVGATIRVVVEATSAAGISEARSAPSATVTQAEAVSEQPPAPTPEPGATPAPGGSSETHPVGSSGGAALAWGENYYGGLGQFYRDTREEWPVGVEGLSNITSVADAGSVTLALLANGEVASWGANLHGQLGNNGFKANWEIGAGHVTVRLSGATAVAAANEHALAMVGSAPKATVRRLGVQRLRDAGQRQGRICRRAHTAPVAGLSGVKAIAAGGASDYALLGNGTVEGWGSNTSGQLSAEHWPLECTRHNTCKNPELLCSTEVGQELCSKVPRFVVTSAGKPLEHVKRIVAGAEAAYALLENGEVMSWGQDRLGQLGQYPAVEPGPHSNFHAPGLVMMNGAKGTEALRGVTELVAGPNHVLARLENGEVVGWGDNAKGELGVPAHPELCVTGTEIPCFKTARPIQGLAKLIAGSKGHAAEALAAGGQYSLALIEHRVYAWGKNGNGELGQGTWTGPESCTSAAELAKNSGKVAQKEAEALEAEQHERQREAHGEHVLKTPQQIERELATALRVLKKELEKAGACSRVPAVLRERGPEVEPGDAAPGATVEHVSAIAAAPTHALALLQPGYAAPAAPVTVTSGLVAELGEPSRPALTFAWSRDIERMLFRTFQRPGEDEAEEEAGESEGDRCLAAEECVEVKEGNEGGSGVPDSIALPRVKHEALEEGELATEFREGQTLLATEGKWSGAEPMTFSFQWQRCSLQNICVNVGQPTKSDSYTAGPADVGSTLRAIVTAANGHEPAASAASAQTSLIKSEEERRNSQGESIPFKNPAPGGLMVDELEVPGQTPQPLQEGVAYEFKLTNGEKSMTMVLAPFSGLGL